ncbi:MAG TPA: IPT/TIG domain-containing protein [Pantanalinema sp.]
MPTIRRSGHAARKLLWAAPLSGALLLFGCIGAPSAPGPVAPELVGRVSFDAADARQVQAGLVEIGNRATVSLINAERNRTEASSVTNENGGFVLSFPRAFRPSATESYYLEAVKGLSANRPGNTAARIRTIARFNSGWVTLTNALPGSGIVVDQGTTAIAIAAALRHQNPDPVDFSALIGSYRPSDGNYVPQGGISALDVQRISDIVGALLSGDGDPVAGVSLVLPNTWVRGAAGGGSLAISGVVPPSASVGATVSVLGVGFNLLPASNSVTFNGAGASVNAATPNRLEVSVPFGATSGPVQVRVGSLMASTSSFRVTGAIAGGIATESAGVTSGQIGSP